MNTAHLAVLNRMNTAHLANFERDIVTEGNV